MGFLLLPIAVFGLVIYCWGLELLLSLPWHSPWWHFFMCALTLYYGGYGWSLFFGLAGIILWYGDPERIHESEQNKREKQMKEYMAARQAELKERRQAREFAMRQANEARQRQRAEAREVKRQQIRAFKDERRELGLQVDGINKAIHQLLSSEKQTPAVMRDIHLLNRQMVKLQVRREKLASRVRSLSSQQRDYRSSRRSRRRKKDFAVTLY